MKDGKAVGGDEITNKVWKYGAEKGVEEKLLEVCSKVWRGEG